MPITDQGPAVSRWTACYGGITALKYLILTGLLFSCTSPPEPPDVYGPHAPEKPLKYEPTDFRDVEEAYATVTKNGQENRTIAAKGIKRAKDAEPLILALIAAHDYDLPIPASTIAMFRAELPDWYGVYTAEESKEFARNGAENAGATKRLKYEADKGLNHDKIVEVKDKVISTLTAEVAKREQEIKDGTVKTIKFYAGICFGAAIAALVASVLGKLWFPGIVKELGALGVTLMIAGGGLLAVGHGLDWVQDTLDKHGTYIAAAILGPLLVRWVCIMYLSVKLRAVKTNEEIEDIQEDDAPPKDNLNNT